MSTADALAQRSHGELSKQDSAIANQQGVPKVEWWRLPRASLHTIAGTCAGLIAMAITYPLDFVKIRYIAQDGSFTRGLDGVVRFHGVGEALRRCYSAEGLLPMYRGMSAALYASALSWGLYFGLFRHFQQIYISLFPQQDRKGSSVGTTGDFITASCAGLMATTATSPLWLVKTRMQLQRGATVPLGPAVEQYTSVAHGLRSIVAKEGPRGLFTGLGPSLLMVFHGSLQMSIYERLKDVCRRVGARGGKSRELSSTEIVSCTLVSKIGASALTTPLVVLRTRLQDPRNILSGVEVRYSGLVQAARTIVAREGFLGLYRGLVPTLARTVPNAVITFLCYEKISATLLCFAAEPPPAAAA